MIAYVENGTECRSVVLQRHFGQTDAHPCGVCDVCLEQKRQGTHTLEAQIEALLALSALSAREIADRLPSTSYEEILAAVEALHSAEKVQTSPQGKVQLR